MEIPHQFIAHTKAKAAEVNANNRSFKEAIEENGTKINNVGADLKDFKETIEPQVMPNIKYEVKDGRFIQAVNQNKFKIIKGTTIRLDISENDVRYLEIKEDTEYTVNSILDTGIAALVGGKDYYIYAVQKDVVDEVTEAVTKIVDIKVSANSTYPKDFNENNSRLIGGFHAFCNGMTVSNAPHPNHPLIGYMTGDILPCSVWCLSHRPKSNPAGMAYDEKKDLWGDIYLQGGKDGSPTSVYGATVVDNRQWDNHSWDFTLVKKRMATQDEFVSFAEGCNQKTSIYGSVSPNPKTAGGHVDTSGKRMVSNIGIEEPAGYLWQWLNDVAANGGSGWATYDGSGSKGQVFGGSYALLAGGDWVDGASCGSRAAYGANPRSGVSPGIGGRGVSEPLKSA